MSSSDHWTVLLNPSAGKGKAAASVENLRRGLKKHRISFDILISEDSGHLILLSSTAYQQGCRHFAVIGGDGSVNEVVNGIFSARESEESENSPVSLAVLPWGTGNDWAAYHRVSNSLDSFCRSLCACKGSLQDVGLLHYRERGGKTAKRYFINFVGAGFDSYMLNQMGAARGNRFSYLVNVLRCLRSYVGQEISVALPTSMNQAREEDARKLMVMACLGKFGGAGLKLAPEAEIDDGLFDVLEIRDMPWPMRLVSMLYLLAGKAGWHASVSYSRSETVHFAGSESVFLEVDGEVVGQMPATAEIIPKALTVIGPAD